MNAKLPGSFENAKSRLKKVFDAKIGDLKKKPTLAEFFRMGFLRVLWVGFFGSVFCASPDLYTIFCFEMSLERVAV